MFIFGVIFALVAGILFGLIGPTTKIAYNSGASVALTIFLRYAVASIIILPFIPYQKNLLEIFKKNLKYFLSISAGSILLTIGLLTSVIFIEVSLTILIFCLYPIYVLLFSIIVDKEKISLTVKHLFSNLLPDFSNRDRTLLISTWSTPIPKIIRILFLSPLKDHLFLQLVLFEHCKFL